MLQNENNLGPALSRNKAIEKSSGRFLAFLDSDDCWTVDKLIKQVAFMKKKNAPFTCTYFSQITEDGVFMKNVDNIPSKLSYSDIIKSNTDRDPEVALGITGGLVLGTMISGARD